jgi:glutathione S-transferase
VKIYGDLGSGNCLKVTVADISILAYTRLAHEGGFDLARRKVLRGRIVRCQDKLGFAPAATSAA